MSYTYLNPTKIIFGVGSVNELASKVREVNGGHVLIITDQGVVKAGLLESVTDVLNEAKMQYHVYADVKPDPSTALIEELRDTAQSIHCDCIIASGGGSPIDTAKGVSLLMRNGGNLREYGGINQVRNKGIPLIAIPTTAGTGSEVTVFSVVTDQDVDMKFTISSPLIAPDIAILDPQLTLTMPPSVTAATGFDALTHAIESYTSLGGEPITDALSIEAIRLIGQNIAVAVNSNMNLAARTNMLQGALMAGMAFHNSFVGLCHAIASPLGAHFHIPHGLAVAIMLPHVMEFNIAVCPEKFVAIAQTLHVEQLGADIYEKASCAVYAVRSLLKICGIPLTLREAGATEDKLDQVAKDSFLSIQLGYNPRSASLEQIRQIVSQAY